MFFNTGQEGTSLFMKCGYSLSQSTNSHNYFPKHIQTYLKNDSFEGWVLLFFPLASSGNLLNKCTVLWIWKILLISKLKFVKITDRCQKKSVCLEAKAEFLLTSNILYPGSWLAFPHINDFLGINIMGVSYINLNNIGIPLQQTMNKHTKKQICSEYH